MRKSTRLINCDFYRVRMPVGGPDFVTQLSAFMNTPVPSRNVQAEFIEPGAPDPDEHYRVQNIGRFETGMWGALFLRLRPNTDASVTSMSNETLDNLELQNGEVITEYLAFIYMPQFDVVVMHRNREAGNHGRLQRYFERVFGLRPISLDLFMNNDAQDRLDRMTRKARVEVSIANPANLEGLPSGPITDAARAMHKEKAETVTFFLSVGHNKTSLADHVTKNLKELVGLGEATVSKARVWGNELDEGSFVDLIRDRMNDQIKIEVKDGHVSRDNLFWALGQAYDRKYNDIVKQLHKV